MKTYYGIFDGIVSLRKEFEVFDIPDDLDVIVAAYEYENYSGSAFVLFRKDGELYEVNGSHCSCYGLEGQWKPEKASAEELVHRLETDEYTLTTYDAETNAAIASAIRGLVVAK